MMSVAAEQRGNKLLANLEGALILAAIAAPSKSTAKTSSLLGVIS